MYTEDTFEEEIKRLYKSSVNEPAIGPFELRDAVIQGLTLHCLRFIECRLYNVMFIDCDLRGAEFTESALTHVIVYRCAIYGLLLPSQHSAGMVQCFNPLCRAIHRSTDS